MALKQNAASSRTPWRDTDGALIVFLGNHDVGCDHRAWILNVEAIDCFHESRDWSLKFDEAAREKAWWRIVLERIRSIVFLNRIAEIQGFESMILSG